MWTRYAMAVLTLGLWACAPGEMGEERAWEEGRVGQELMRTVGPLQQARYQHSSTRLPDGKVLYVGGGTNSSPSLLASAELYDPATGTMSLVAPMSTARRAHRAVLLQDGSVLVVGGITSAGSTASVERYTPSTNTWTVMPPLPRSSYGHSATLLADGRVLVAGGVGYPTSVYLFDPTANTWSTTGSLALGRMDSATLRLPDNRVLMLGGFTSRTEDRTTVELYDPATGTWSSRSRFPSSNGAPSAVLLPSGRVVLNGTGSSTVEYDVATDTWTQQPSFNRGHSSGKLVLAGGTPVVVAGAFDERSIERFDPALQRWDIVGELSIARNDITVDVLADDSVVIAGGSQTNTYVPYATMDLYSGSGSCAPLTCAGAGAQCGSLADGCGGTLQCGTCGTGYTCTASNQCIVPADFSVSLSPASQSVQAGNAVSYTVSTSGQGTLTLSASGLPAGTTATFSPATVTAGQSATLTVSTSGSTPVGPHSFTVKGTDSSTQAVRSASAQLSVTAPAQTGSSFSYSATNTNSAQQNTTNHSVYLNAGQTLRMGTCTVTGASGSGDTYLRLYGVSGTQVASNDDSCGVLSYLSYTATQSGTYQIRAGCWSSGSCSGVVAYTLQ